jgi:hypothetical protein
MSVARPRSATRPRRRPFSWPVDVTTEVVLTTYLPRRRLVASADHPSHLPLCSVRQRDHSGDARVRLDAVDRRIHELPEFRQRNALWARLLSTSKMITF